VRRTQRGDQRLAAPTPTTRSLTRRIAGLFVRGRLGALDGLARGCVRRTALQHDHLGAALLRALRTLTAALRTLTAALRTLAIVRAFSALGALSILWALSTLRALPVLRVLRALRFPLPVA